MVRATGMQRVSMRGLKEQRPDTFSCCFASETESIIWAWCLYTTLENGKLIVQVYFARTVKVGSMASAKSRNFAHE